MSSQLYITAQALKRLVKDVDFYTEEEKRQSERIKTLQETPEDQQGENHIYLLKQERVAEDETRQMPFLMRPQIRGTRDKLRYLVTQEKAKEEEANQDEIQSAESVISEAENFLA